MKPGLDRLLSRPGSFFMGITRGTPFGYIYCVVEGRVSQCAYDPDILKSGQESGRSPSACPWMHRSKGWRNGQIRFCCVGHDAEGCVCRVGQSTGDLICFRHKTVQNRICPVRQGLQHTGNRRTTAVHRTGAHQERRPSLSDFVHRVLLPACRRPPDFFLLGCPVSLPGRESIRRAAVKTMTDAMPRRASGILGA